MENNNGSITWIQFEREQPDTILYKVGYDQKEEFKKIKAIWSLQQNATSKPSGYTIDAFSPIQYWNKTSNTESQAGRSFTAVQGSNNSFLPPSVL